MIDYPSTKPELNYNYLLELVKFCNNHFNLITYKDLNLSLGYNLEFTQWCLKNKKPSLLFHFDVDSNPEISMQLMKDLLKLKIKSTFMIFNKKIFDFKLKQKNLLEYDENYHINFELCKQYEYFGGLVVYHCNAYDRSNHDKEKAIDIFYDDIHQIEKKGLSIKYFSMHGGQVDSDGFCNAKLDIKNKFFKKNLHWVHNGKSPIFNFTLSDGSASNPSYLNETTNMFDGISGLKKGMRNRILLHPQYYKLANKKFSFPILYDSQWCKDVDKNINNLNNFFANKLNLQIEDSKNFEKFYDCDWRSEKPIFVHGMSRTGTTLLCQILDSHSKINMSFESYINYVLPKTNQILDRNDYMYFYYVLENFSENKAVNLLKNRGLEQFVKFFAVTTWTGMSQSTQSKYLRAFFQKYHHLNGNKQMAMRLVFGTCRYNLSSNDNFWGSKYNDNFDELLNFIPKSKIIIISRNPYDTFYSLKTNGSFNITLDKFLTMYKNFNIKINKYKNNKNFFFIKYEKIIDNFDNEISNLCNFLNIDYEYKMKQFYTTKNYLVKNPRGQLSAKQITKKIYNNIGQNKLTYEEKEKIKIFYEKLF